MQGLRTLVLASRVLPEDEYAAWALDYHEAAGSLDDREARIAAVRSQHSAPGLMRRVRSWLCSRLFSNPSWVCPSRTWNSRARPATDVYPAAAETSFTVCCRCIKHGLVPVGTTAPGSKLQGGLLSAHPASTGAHNPKPGVLQVAERIERDLELVGITAIEDKLQDGVPDTIRLLIDAGMKARSRINFFQPAPFCILGF